MPRKGKYRTPGPGAYENSIRPIGTAAPAFSIGTKWSGESVSSGGPGPGSYTPGSQYGAPAYTIPGRLRGHTEGRQANPGPGAYDTHSSLCVKRGPAFSLGCKFLNNQGIQTPGPGAYTVRGTKDAPAYTMSVKHTPRGEWTGPGPGAYVNTNSNCSRPRSPAYSIASKCSPRLKDEAVLPGPGAYSPSPRDSGPKFTFPSKPSGKGPFEGPGPGSYELDTKATMKREPAFTLSSRPEGRPSDKTPGPGAYTPRAHIENAPAFSMGSKLERKGAPQTPGPGAYYSDDHSASPAFSIAGKGCQAAPDTKPGPGAYTPRNVGARTPPAFTMSRRTQDGSSGHITPGPADYHPDSYRLVQKAAPAFTIGTRKFKSPQDIFPGPGAYDCQNFSRGPACKIGTEERFEDF